MWNTICFLASKIVNSFVVGWVKKVQIVRNPLWTFPYQLFPYVYDCQLYYCLKKLTIAQWRNVLPSLQQSKFLLPCPKIGKQLSFPHIRSPEQSKSKSQSPSPIAHLFFDVQQSFSEPNLPSQPEVDSMRGGIYLIIMSIVNYFLISSIGTSDLRVNFCSNLD